LSLVGSASCVTSWCVSTPCPENAITTVSSGSAANGGEIEIRERSDLDRARRIAYILSQAAATKVEPWGVSAQKAAGAAAAEWPVPAMQWTGSVKLRSCNPTVSDLDIGPFHRAPGYPMSSLFLPGIVRMRVPGVVERLAINILRMVG
jgi:hypothetical protein